MDAAEKEKELLALAKEEGYGLTDEELMSVSGGYWYERGGYCPLDRKI